MLTVILVLSTSACILEIVQHIFCCSMLYTLLRSPLFYSFIIKGKGEMYCKIHVFYGHSHCICDPTSAQPISITKTLLIVPTKNESDPPLFTGKLLIRFQNILRNTTQVIIRQMFLTFNSLLYRHPGIFIN
jgi:hypothetical protein